MTGLTTDPRAAGKNAAGKPRRGKRFVFALLALGLAGAAAVGAYRHYYRTSPPTATPYSPILPRLPAEQEVKVLREMRVIAQTILRVTPEQAKQLAAIWRRLPQTPDELIEYQRRTDAVLTPLQRTLVRPVRRALRDYAIDQMVEPARKRFTPEDFERFRSTIKNRVNQRVAAAEND